LAASISASDASSSSSPSTAFSIAEARSGARVLATCARWGRRAASRSGRRFGYSLIELFDLAAELGGAAHCPAAVGSLLGENDGWELACLFQQGAAAFVQFIEGGLRGLRGGRLADRGGQVGRARDPELQWRAG
jgi:hypothetical protein